MAFHFLILVSYSFKCHYYNKKTIEESGKRFQLMYFT